MKKFLWILSFFSCAGIFALGNNPSQTRVDCQAKVALNRLYTVTLDTATKEVSIKTDNNYQMSGTANLYYSPRSNSNTYFLATGFGSGIEVEMELSGQQRIAMCLASNECYICR